MKESDYSMKKIISRLSVLTVILMLVGVLAACSKNNEVTNNNKTSHGANKIEDGKLSGTLTISGSTSMEKLANIAIEAFMLKYPDVMASAEFVGSSTGVEQVIARAVDIGNAS